MFPQSNEIASLKILETTCRGWVSSDTIWQRTLLHLSPIMTRCVDNAFLISVVILGVQKWAESSYRENETTLPSGSLLHSKQKTYGRVRGRCEDKGMTCACWLGIVIRIILVHRDHHSSSLSVPLHPPKWAQRQKQDSRHKFIVASADIISPCLQGS